MRFCLSLALPKCLNRRSATENLPVDLVHDALLDELVDLLGLILPAHQPFGDVVDCQSILAPLDCVLQLRIKVVAIQRFGLIVVSGWLLYCFFECESWRLASGSHYLLNLKLK
jgi:hypothetical protein